MTLDVFREHNGAFQKLGSFADSSGSGWAFAYDRDYLDSPAAQPLSLSLPLREEAYSRDEFQGFFEGMIPEGVVRTDLAHRFHLSPSDFVGMLDRIGGECVGALQLLNSDLTQESPSLVPWNESDAARLFAHPESCAVELLQATRLSLAGAQTKFGVYVSPGDDASDMDRWFKPFGTAPSTHIVKVADGRFPDLAFNELACMVLAKECGLPVPAVSVVKGCPTALVVERFDRSFAEADAEFEGRTLPRRLHQEDFCQALGWAPYLKYQVDNVNYARLSGRLIDRISSDPIADKRVFVQSIVFDYLVGNCDNHLKNHAFLYSADWQEKRLAPLYDIVSTTLLGFDRKLGFAIGQHILIDEVMLQDWPLLAGDCGIGKQEMNEILHDVIDRVPAAVNRAEKELPKQGKAQLERIVQDMQPRLSAIATP